MALTKQRWTVAALLGLMGLVKPLLGVTGVYRTLRGPAGPLGITAVVAVAWVATVVLRRDRRPVATLALAGAVSGGLVVVVQAIANAVLAPGSMPVPVLVIRPVWIMTASVAWGAILGLVASALLGERRRE